MDGRVVCWRVCVWVCVGVCVSWFLQRVFSPAKAKIARLVLRGPAMFDPCRAGLSIAKDPVLTGLDSTRRALGDDLLLALVIPCPIRPRLFCFLLAFFFFLFFGNGDVGGCCFCFFLPRLPPFFFVSPVPARFLVFSPPPRPPSHAMAKAAGPSEAQG